LLFCAAGIDVVNAAYQSASRLRSQHTVTKYMDADEDPKKELQRLREENKLLRVQLGELVDSSGNVRTMRGRRSVHPDMVTAFVQLEGFKDKYISSDVGEQSNDSSDKKASGDEDKDGETDNTKDDKDEEGEEEEQQEEEEEDAEKGRLSDRKADLARLKRNASRLSFELDENVGEQREIEAEIIRFDNAPASDREINTSIQKVVSETSSPGLGKVLGSMWKEMREYAWPYYREHLEQLLKELKEDEEKMQANLEEADDKLKKAKEADRAEQEDKKDKQEKKAKIAKNNTAQAVVMRRKTRTKMSTRRMTLMLAMAK